MNPTRHPLVARWVLVLLGVPGLLGCVSTLPRPREGLKEVYVEAFRAVGAVDLRPYPLDPRNEERAFAAVRNLSGRAESLEKLGRLLGRWPGEPAPIDSASAPVREPRAPVAEADVAKAEAPAEGSGAPLQGSGPSPTSNASEPEELEALLEDDHPFLLLLPESSRAREEGACYLGHAAFVRPSYDPYPGVVHHVRLLVINRGRYRLRLPVDQFQIALGDATRSPVAAFAGGEAWDGDDATALTRLAAANARGERLDDALIVPPRGERLLHVFFESRRLPRALAVRWNVEEELDPDSGSPSASETPTKASGAGLPGANAAEAGGEGAPRRRTFTALLVRRYLLQRGRFTDLEARVALGERLPRERPETWTEPRVTAVGGGGP